MNILPNSVVDAWPPISGGSFTAHLDGDPGMELSCLAEWISTIICREVLQDSTPKLISGLNVPTVSKIPQGKKKKTSLHTLVILFFTTVTTILATAM